MIRFHNSLTGRKEPLVAITPRHLRMYVCGITVYDYIHIGHARMLVVFDTLYRYLRVRGFDVTYVRNITDIDDKIIRRAIESGEGIEALTARFIAAMHEDGARLGLASPTHEPRATQYIPQIVEMIQSLVDGGFAYRTAAGDVLYSVARFEPYGKLSGKRLADLRAGARVEVDESKHDPLDFVLWKAAKPGEPFWESPWGRGRPGWHIECSAMSTSLLGTHFDLHGGGMDLKFPHHENEIAQSCAATGDTFVNVWMHNGFVNIDDEKMSKSLGNFFTAREVLDTLRDPEVLRYFIHASHYRGPINYSPPQLEQADAALTRIYTALRDLPRMPAEAGAYTERFNEVMDDDLNTPEAIAVLQAMAREINTLRAGAGGGSSLAQAASGDVQPAVSRDVARAAAIAAELVALGAVLGIAQQDPAVWFQRPPGVTPKAAHGTQASDAAGGTREAMSHERIDALIAQRLAARRAKNWAESDRIRDELAAAGIVLEDKSGGVTTWRRG